MEFQEAVQNFMQHLHTSFPDQKFEIQEGKKYLKIVKKSVYSSVYCFIAKEQIDNKNLFFSAGSICKPANWNTPAKHARGNVFKPETYCCAGPYGMAYLK